MLLLRRASSPVLPPSIRSSRSSSRSFHGHAAASTAIAAAATAGANKGNLSRGLISATSSGGSCLGVVSASMLFSTETKTAPAAAAVESETAAVKDWSPEDPDGKLPPSLKIQDNPPTGAMLSATWEYQDVIIQAKANNPLLQEEGEGEEDGRFFFPLEVRFLSKGEESGWKVKFDAQVYHDRITLTRFSVRRHRIKPGGVIEELLVNRKWPVGLKGTADEFEPFEFFNDLWHHRGIKLSATIHFIYRYLTNKRKTDHGA